MNVYDSEKIADILAIKCQMVDVDSPDQADLLVLNTCSIREKAQEKVFSELGRWNKQLKKNNQQAMIAVGGCVASQEGSKIIERAPYVDIVFGPQTLHRLPDMIAARRKLNGKRQSVVDISFPEIEKFDNLAVPQARGVSAFVSIMEGCSKYCSFCVVPYTRGEEVSRPPRQIRQEIIKLTHQGVKEITLLGQNVNAYSYDSMGFAQILYMVADIPEVQRIRFTSPHPMEFSDEQIKCYADLPQLADQLHLPMQSGADRILALMKRGHTALEYKERIHKLRQVRPDISISSDFIVGFPGETEDEHQATMKLVRDIGFDKSYSFVYSMRPGTPAAYLEDNTNKEEKMLRLHELQELLNSQAAAIGKGMVASRCNILVDDYSRKDPGMLQGRTENNRLVNFVCGDANLIGEFAAVDIIEALPNSLRGVLVEGVEQAPNKDKSRKQVTPRVS